MKRELYFMFVRASREELIDRMLRDGYVDLPVPLLRLVTIHAFQIARVREHQ